MSETPEKEYKVVFHLSDGSVFDTFLTDTLIENLVYMLPPTFRIRNTVMMTNHILYFEIFDITTKTLEPEEETGTTAYVGSN